MTRQELQQRWRRRRALRIVGRPPKEIQRWRFRFNLWDAFVSFNRRRRRANRTMRKLAKLHECTRLPRCDHPMWCEACERVRGGRDRRPDSGRLGPLVRVGLRATREHLRTGRGATRRVGFSGRQSPRSGQRGDACVRRARPSAAGEGLHGTDSACGDSPEIMWRSRREPESTLSDLRKRNR